MSGRRGGGIPVPERFSGLEAWYKAETITVSDAAKVTAWNDSGPKGRHLAQATEANQPTFTAAYSGHNNRPAVHFVTPTWLRGTFTGQTFSDGVTIFAVVTWVNNANSYPGLIELGTGSVNSGAIIYGVKSNQQIYWRVKGCSGSNPGDVGCYGATMATTPAVVCGTYAAANSTVYESEWTNSGQSSSGGAPNTSWTTIDVGRQPTSGAEMDGYVSEVIVYSRRLADAERQALTRHLCRKYGILYRENAKTQNVTVATPDASGKSVHPSVYDAGEGNTWNGKRYWMGFATDTGSISSETICLDVSDDGLTWTQPAGLTNPIQAYPGGSPPWYVADSELLMDGSTLWYYYIRTNDTSTDRLVVRSSTDGVTWSAESSTLIETVNAPGLVSPAVVKLGTGSYAMWTVGHRETGNTIRRYMATSPNGTWTFDQVCTMTGFLAGREPWHIDVFADGTDLYMIVAHQPTGTYGSDQKLLMAKSTDSGVTWTCGPTIMREASGGLQNKMLYRACGYFTPDGTKLRLWYSSAGTTSQFWIWYTEIPRGELGV